MAAALKVFIVGYYGFDNAGDEAILHAIVTDLRALQPGVAITAASFNAPATSEMHGIAAISWRDNAAMLDAIAEADVTIVGGGGLFHDYWGLDPTLFLTDLQTGVGYYTAPAFLAALLAKPLVLYAIGAGPLLSGPAKQFTRVACEAATAITVRDEGSKAVLESIGVGGDRITVTADPALGLAVPEGIEIEEIASPGAGAKRPLVAVSVRSWEFGVRSAFWEREFAAGLDRFLDNEGGTIVFVPFEKLAGEHENDIAVSERIRAQMRFRDNTIVVSRGLAPAELLSVFGHCNLTVAMRLHGLIFSVLNRVPAVAVSYDAKVDAFTERIGLPHAIDVKALDAGSLARAMSEALARTEEFRASIPEKLNVLADLARKNAEIALAAVGKDGRRPGYWPSAEAASLLVRGLRGNFIDRRSMRAEIKKMIGDLDKAWADLRDVTAQRQNENRTLTQRLEETGADSNRFQAERDSLANQLRVSEDRLRAEQEGRASAQRELATTQAWLRASDLGRRTAAKLMEEQRARLDSLASAYRSEKAWKLLLYLMEKEVRLPDQMRHAPDSHAEGFDFSSTITPQRVGPAQWNQYDVIVFGIIDFDFRFQRPQQIAAQFARTGHRVFWISPSRFLPPSSEFPYELLHIRENIWEVHLRTEHLDIYMGRLDPPRARAVAASVDELCRDQGVAENLVLLQLPFWRQIGLSVREKCGSVLAYDCMDDWETFENLGEFNVQEERNLVKEADVLAVTGKGLEDKFRELNPVLARNGADYDFFARAHPADLLAGVPRPIVGYFGAIADWIDLDLVHEVAVLRPLYSFVLIGEVFGRDTSALDALPNVYLLGNQRYTRIPTFLTEFDACIIPFLLNQVTKSTDPVKVYEYLSQGKPVVATDMAELAQLGDLIYIGRGAQEFAGKIDAALTEKETDLRPRRIEFARKNTWSRRVEAIDARVRSCFPLVSVLIVTHNSAEFVAPCLESIRDATAWPNREIIVVDNASSDDTAGLLREYAATDPRIQVECLAQNTGFAAGNNLAARKAKGEYQILLNIDTMVTAGWIERLLRHVRRNPSIGVICPVTNFAGNEVKVNIDYIDAAEMQRFALKLAAEQQGKILDIDVVPFFCTLIPRKVWDEVGELDEGFGIGMYEDDDFCMRVRQAGYRVTAAEDCFVHHFGQGSFSKMPFEEYKAIAEVNRLRFNAKWQTEWQPHQTRPGIRPASEEIRFTPAAFCTSGH